MLINSLLRNGVLWSIIETFTRRGLHFVIGIILARLLTPSDYGMVGICSVLIAFGNIFVGGGFGIALIRKQHCSDQDYSTVLIYSVIISFAVFVVIYHLSPVISEFYDKPELVNLLRCLSLTIPVGAFSLVPKTILTKNVDFKSQVKIEGLAMLTSGLTGILLAFNGWGVWSLVIQALILSVLLAFQYWRACSWLPSWYFSWKSFRDLFTFGSNLLIGDIVNLLYKNAYYIVIGKYLSTAHLGYFTRADSTVNMVTNNVTNSLKRASYPVLSKLQNDENSLKAIYRRLVKNTYFIFSSLILGLAAMSESLIFLLFGERWLPSVKYMQLLCLSSYFMPLIIFNLNIINVKGRSDVYLKLQIGSKIFGIPAITLGIYAGIEEMIIGFGIASFIYMIVTNYFSTKLINYRPREKVEDMATIVLVSIAINLVVYSIGILNVGYLFEFILQFIVTIILTALTYNLISYQPYLNFQDALIKRIQNL